MNMVVPRISVIVPVYNAEISIRRCVDSILHQTFKDFELILVDDGSKDNSGLICDSYLSDSRVRVIHKPNGGVSSARNMALEIARGVYVTFCDADDEVLPGWLDDFMEGIGVADLCMQGFIAVDIKGSNPKPRVPRFYHWNDVPEFLEHIKGGKTKRAFAWSSGLRIKRLWLEGYRWRGAGRCKNETCKKVYMS